MGIDIRDGFQLECIGCGLCIDACDEVMHKVGRPLHLIEYDSERNQELRQAGQPPARRLVRPRTILYAGVLGVVGLTMLIVLGRRPTMDVNILPDRNPLFVTLADGSIRNGYTVRLINKQRAPRVFRLGAAGVDGRLSVVGQPSHGATVTLPVPPDGVATHRFFLQLPRAEVEAEVNDVTFQLEDPRTGNVATVDTIFRGPGR
jgi:polyferredoxin